MEKLSAMLGSADASLLKMLKELGVSALEDNNETYYRHQLVAKLEDKKQQVGVRVMMMGKARKITIFSPLTSTFSLNFIFAFTVGLLYSFLSDFREYSSFCYEKVCFCKKV